MKSRAFAQFRVSDENRKGYDSIAALSPETLEKLAAWFEQDKLRNYPVLLSSDLKALSDQTGASAETLRRAIQASDGFLRYMGQFADSPEALVDDLISLGVTPNRSLPLTEFLRRLAPIAPKYYQFTRTSDVARGGCANLDDVTMTVAVKPVFDRDFRYGEDDITKYDPSVIGSVAVAQVSIERDDTRDRYSFQLTKDTLDRFITDLLAIQKEMVTAEKLLRIEPKK